MLYTHLHLSLPSGPFPSGFHNNKLYVVHFSPIQATCPAHLILLDLIILIILGKNTHYIDPHAVFCTLPSLNPPSVQIFSSAPCSQTPSVCVPCVMSETKFHTHTEPKAKFLSYIFKFLRSLKADKTEGSGPNGSMHYQTAISS
jgi:hypothetical protein